MPLHTNLNEDIRSVAVLVAFSAVPRQPALSNGATAVSHRSIAQAV